MPYSSKIQTIIAILLALLLAERLWRGAQQVGEVPEGCGKRASDPCYVEVIELPKPRPVDAPCGTTVNPCWMQIAPSRVPIPNR